MGPGSSPGMRLILSGQPCVYPSPWRKAGPKPEAIRRRQWRKGVERLAYRSRPSPIRHAEPAQAWTLDQVQGCGWFYLHSREFARRPGVRQGRSLRPFDGENGGKGWKGRPIAPGPHPSVTPNRLRHGPWIRSRDAVGFVRTAVAWAGVTVGGGTSPPTPRV